MSSQPPLLVICGPTASGKSALAMQIASEFGGEIICADSRTVYKGMDIGTAKPSRANQQQVKHHLLDVVTPNEAFNAFDFQQQAKAAIRDIRQRAKLPIMVGGTGLYIDSVIFDYQFPAPSNKPQRDKLEAMSLEEFYKYCIRYNINLPPNYKNKRHVINQIVRKNIHPKRRKKPIENIIVVAIATEKEKLKDKITQRTEHFFENGVVSEAKILGEIYGWNSEAITGNIYRLAHQIIDGTLSIEAAKEKNTILDWRLAKRQLTWLKRNPFIHWGSQEALYAYVTNQLTARK